MAFIVVVHFGGMILIFVLFLLQKQVHWTCLSIAYLELFRLKLEVLQFSDRSI